MKTLLIVFAILFGQSAEQSLPTVDPLQSTVRINIQSMDRGSVSSGTVIASTKDESVILGCAHAFWKHRAKPYVAIDLFDGTPHGSAEQSIKIATHKATRFIFDDSLDLAVFWIKPGTVLPRSRLAPRGWMPQLGDQMRCYGCRDGADPNFYRCEVQELDFRSQYIKSPHWRGIQCSWSATQGRSGGGLFTSEGVLCGVLNRCSGTDNATVPPPWSCSNFATPATIYRFLDANGLGWLDGVTPKTVGK